MKKDLAFVVLFCNKAEQTIEGLEDWLQYDSPIYLLNNGSGPKGTKIVEDFIKGNRNIHYYKVKNNLGVSKGRNYLIKKVKESWLFFLDNDITIGTPNWQEVLESKMKEEPNTLIFVPQIINTHLGNKPEKFYKFTIKGEKAGFKMFNKGRTNKISGGACIVHKDIFEKNGLYDERFFVGFEDYEFSIRAMKSGEPLDCLCVPEIQLLHNHRKGFRLEDNSYLDVRYNEEKILNSYYLVKEIHGIELPNTGVVWSKDRNAKMKIEKERSGLKRILLYTNDQAAIGGVETFNENFCKRMSRWYEVTFVCRRGDSQRLQRMSKFCDVVIDTGQGFETDICIYAQTWGHRALNIKADRYIQMLHGDYGWLKKTEGFEYTKMPNVTEHVACGDYVAEKFEEVTGYKATPIHNLLDDEIEVKDLLKFITISRVTRYKGFELMPQFIEKLKEKDIPFQWLVFGDSTIPAFEKKIKSLLAEHREVIFMGPRHSPMEWIKDADYSVLLSESEGFPFAVYESLQVGTPAIISDFPSGGELVKHGVNGYILDRTLSNLDVEELYKKKIKGFTFKPKSTDNTWKKYLGGASPKKVEYEPKEPPVRELVCLRDFTDIEAGCSRKRGDIFTVSQIRAAELLRNSVKVVEERIC